jgi:hypothetical protein
MSTLYQALGIQPTADGEAIQRAFRDLASVHHPDRLATDDAGHERFKQITAAYAVLKNPATRAAYDTELKTTRRQRKRDLLICALAAALSFGAVSGGILLFRDARAEQQLVLREPPAPEVEQATPRPAAPQHKLPSLAEFIAPIEERPAPAPTEIATRDNAQPLATTLATPPAEEAGERTRLPVEELKSAKAVELAPTTVVRVWTRPQGTARGVRSGYEAKTFTVPRERPEDPRPAKEGRSPDTQDAAKTARALFP